MFHYGFFFFFGLKQWLWICLYDFQPLIVIVLFEVKHHEPKRKPTLKINAAVFSVAFVFMNMEKYIYFQYSVSTKPHGKYHSLQPFFFFFLCYQKFFWVLQLVFSTHSFCRSVKSLWNMHRMFEIHSMFQIYSQICGDTVKKVWEASACDWKSSSTLRCYIFTTIVLTINLLKNKKWKVFI